MLTTKCLARPEAGDKKKKKKKRKKYDDVYFVHPMRVNTARPTLARVSRCRFYVRSRVSGQVSRRCVVL